MLRHRLTRLAAVLAAVALSGATACDDEDVLLLPLDDVVVTIHDPAFNFGAITTFAIPDSLVHLIPRNGVQLPLTRAFDDEILDRVRTNMLARGYTEWVDTLGAFPPDVVLLVGASASENYNAFVSYEWFSYWGWYGWSNGSPDWTIAYPVVSVQSVEFGTILVDMVPLVTINPLARQINSVWAGAGIGVLDGSASVDRVNNAIDEMFAQSPFIQKF